jgi:hypothetical protein
MSTLFLNRKEELKIEKVGREIRSFSFRGWGLEGEISHLWKLVRRCRPQKLRAHPQRRGLAAEVTLTSRFERVE